MDNATKAILISGGILLALLTLSLLTVMFKNIGVMSESQEQKAVTQDLQEWNAEWEAYNKKIMYGSDVITVYNKAEELKSEYPNDSSYHVDVRVVYANTSQMSYDDLLENKVAIFSCKNVHYNDEGRVDSMTFQFKRR